MRMMILAGSATGLALVAVLVLTGRSEGQQAGFLPYTDPEIVAQGAEIYATECAACHGAALEGQPDWRSPLPTGRMPAPPHDPSGHTWHHPDEQLFALTKYGPARLIEGYESDMPGFEGVLSDAEIIAALAYIKSTWPAPVIAQHETINARARN